MSNKVFGAALCAGILLACAAAHATVVTATFKGTVSGGFDQTGVFGPKNTDLTGAAFTAVYTIDDTIPANYVDQPPIESDISGGTDYGYPKSPVSADLTINGTTLHIGGIATGSVGQWLPHFGLPIHTGYWAQDYWQNGFQFFQSSIQLEVWSYTDAFLKSYDYHTPFVHTLQADDLFQGYAHGFYQYTTTDSGWWYADLIPASVEVTSGPFTAVPEPATLIVFGAGLVGALRLRRQRRK